jgi:hypothetical protein
MENLSIAFEKGEGGVAECKEVQLTAGICGAQGHLCAYVSRKGE